MSDNKDANRIDRTDDATNGRRDAQTSDQAEADAITPNPPRTKSGDKFAAPKFGSAGGGGAELEPGPERD